MNSSKKPRGDTALRSALIHLAVSELDEELLPPDLRPDEYDEFAARLRGDTADELRPVDNVNAGKRKRK